jgi:hypothetical protein
MGKIPYIRENYNVFLGRNLKKRNGSKWLAFPADLG